MYRKIVKPFLDFVFAFLISPLLLICFMVVGTIILIDDGGPIIYKSKRLGLNGKPFTMYKFRSMKVNSPDLRNSDGSTFSSATDNRLTKIGKFMRESSIDELPQFINVLLFQMSVLGPRPDTLEWFEKSDKNVQKKYTVKPGISGYTQANFRNVLPLEEKNKYEVFYAENVSFVMDVKIFFQTIGRIFNRKNVYRGKSPEKTLNDQSDKNV
jgi:undecaprenyl phosphate N,N'-diacetylbacillosamine 1-phosphate transferase